MKTTKSIVYGAIIAAAYTALTLIFMPWSYGLMQVHISEALTILPFFFPSAVPGLFIGCIIVNLIGGYGPLDIIFGSLATLIAAFATSRIRNKFLAPLPAVITNAVMVGGMLFYVMLGTSDAVPLWLAMLQVGAGELIACYALGLPLLLVLNKYRAKLGDPAMLRSF